MNAVVTHCKHNICIIKQKIIWELAQIEDVKDAAELHLYTRNYEIIYIIWLVFVSGIVSRDLLCSVWHNIMTRAFHTFISEHKLLNCFFWLLGFLRLLRLSTTICGIHFFYFHRKTECRMHRKYVLLYMPKVLHQQYLNIILLMYMYKISEKSQTHTCIKINCQPFFFNDLHSLSKLWLIWRREDH